MKKSAFLAILFFLFSFNAAAYEYISFDLAAIYKNKISHDLRKTFDDYLNNKNLDVPREMHAVSPNNLKFFKEKFLVLQINKNPFGGYSLWILIAPKTLRSWKIWIYETGEGEYQIRNLQEKIIEKRDLQEFEGFLSKENQEYWL